MGEVWDVHSFCWVHCLEIWPCYNGIALYWWLFDFFPLHILSYIIQFILYSYHVRLLLLGEKCISDFIFLFWQLAHASLSIGDGMVHICTYLVIIVVSISLKYKSSWRATFLFHFSTTFLVIILAWFSSLLTYTSLYHPCMIICISFICSITACCFM